VTDADRFHIPPSEAVKQPVMAMSVIDLKPLIVWWQQEQQRERDRCAVERTTASSAREALAACEERVKAMTDKAEEWRRQCCELVTRNARLVADGEHSLASIGEMAADIATLRGELNDANEARLRALAEVNRYAVERDNALAQLEHARCDAKDAQQMLMDERKRGAVPVPTMEPGSVHAVIEAYRLLVGDCLEWNKPSGWHDNATCSDSNLELATLRLIHWLDEHATGGWP
jgi:4-alpha-glucanotransferase